MRASVFSLLDTQARKLEIRDMSSGFAAFVWRDLSWKITMSLKRYWATTSIGRRLKCCKEVGFAGEMRSAGESFVDGKFSLVGCDGV